MRFANCLRPTNIFFIILIVLGLLALLATWNRSQLPVINFTRDNQSTSLFQFLTLPDSQPPTKSGRDQYIIEVNLNNIPSTNLDHIEDLHGREFWASFKPSYQCPPALLTKVGGTNDGGKWVCGLETLGKRTVKDGYNCTVYSFGVSGDSRFEAEVLVNTQCTVFAYDPSTNSIASPLKSNNPRVYFEKIGISGEDSPDRKTLKSLMLQNGHTFIDILKMDVEGAEFSSLDKMMDDFEELPFGQLQVEFHHRGVLKMVRKLEAKGARLFYNEPNQVYPGLCGELAFFNPKYRRLFID